MKTKCWNIIIKNYNSTRAILVFYINNCNCYIMFIWGFLTRMMPDAFCFFDKDKYTHVTETD